MTEARPTLRSLLALPDTPAPLCTSAPAGGVLSARELHDGALTSLADMFAIVVPSGDKIPA